MTLKTYAIIENDKIVNIAKAKQPLKDNWIELETGFGIGDLFINGKFVKKDISADFENYKNQKLQQLKKELQDFIYSHYDQGTQASFIALYQQAKEQNNIEALTQIQKVWDWIQSVLDYYYSKKEAIGKTTNYTELEDIIWNWQDVEETEHTELREVIQILNQ